MLIPSRTIDHVLLQSADVAFQRADSLSLHIALNDTERSLHRAESRIPLLVEFLESVGEELVDELRLLAEFVLKAAVDQLGLLAKLCFD